MKRGFFYTMIIVFSLLVFTLSGCEGRGAEDIPKGSAENEVSLFPQNKDTEAIETSGNTEETAGDQETLDSTEETSDEPHIHHYIEQVILPDCETDGYTLHTCSCGDTYTDGIVSASGHRYTETIVAPECVSQGYTVYRCACGKEYRGNDTLAAGHQYGEWNMTKTPSVTEEGSQTRICQNCGNKEIQSVARKSPEWTVDMAIAYAKDYIDHYGGGVFRDETLHYSDDGEGGGWMTPTGLYYSESWPKTQERIKTAIDRTIMYRGGNAVLEGRAYNGLRAFFTQETLPLNGSDVDVYIFQGILSSHPVKHGEECKQR